MRGHSAIIVAFSILAASCGAGAPAASGAEDQSARNKEIARRFYEDLWFTDNTDKYADYVADEYVVHDVGPRKCVTEDAIEQKTIADFFHDKGEMTGAIDFQIAEGDKVATRWKLSFRPNAEAAASGMPPIDGVAIINVFRFNRDGKIVEFWNHRHDVELPRPREIGFADK